MSNIGRGTTPTNTFNTSFDLTEATVIYVTYAQQNQIVFEKTLEAMKKI